MFIRLCVVVFFLFGWVGTTWGSFDENAPIFLRGDSNNDGVVNISDASYTSDYLFNSGPPPLCMDAADANDDGVVTGADASYTVSWYSSGGPPPPSPGPFSCGEDATDTDGLDCGDHTCME